MPRKFFESFFESLQKRPHPIFDLPIPFVGDFVTEESLSGSLGFKLLIRVPRTAQSRGLLKARLTSSSPPCGFTVEPAPSITPTIRALNAPSQTQTHRQNDGTENTRIEQIGFRFAPAASSSACSPPLPIRVTPAAHVDGELHSRASSTCSRPRAGSEKLLTFYIESLTVGV